jgi:hypothetical protein
MTALAEDQFEPPGDNHQNQCCKRAGEKKVASYQAN